LSQPARASIFDCPGYKLVLCGRFSILWCTHREIQLRIMC
jgi:hypothetical protein